jgi:outer membrane protein
VDRLALYQLIGVPQPPEVKFTTRIPVAAPGFTLDNVLDLARAGNPALQALEARESAASKGVASAKGNFLPSLTAFAGWGGFANQYTNNNYPVSQATQSYVANYADCAQLDSIRLGVGMAGVNCATITPPDTAAIMKQNNAVKGWHFTNAPFQASVTVSMTVLDGLQRVTTLETAKAQYNDARYRVRAQELRLTADVTSAYLTLQAALQAEQLARANMEQARLALRLAEEKYRVGSATAVDLSTQRNDFQRAVQQLLASTFDFHRAFAALERAVGRPLR